MARLWSSGAELNSIADAVEFTVNQNETISSAVARSGTYSIRISSLSSGASKLARFDFQSAIGTGPFYIRFYFRVATLPTAANRIISMNGGTIRLSIDNTGVLQLADQDGNIGSASSALSTNTWYRIEIKVDASPTAGSEVVEAKLDGTVFATSSTRDLSTNGVSNINFGGNLAAETQTTGEWFFDDIAINDDSGSFQNSYPGSSQIIHLRPNAAGDNSDWGDTNDYTRWDEVTPDDLTTLNEDTDLGTTDVNIDSPGTQMSDDATINCVQVGVRFRSDSTSAAAFVLRIKASASGTTEESGNIVGTNTTWKTNAAAAPGNYPLTLYDLPGASTTAYTKADLETTQIGARHSVDDGNVRVQISTMWLLVDFTQGTALYAKNLTTGTKTTDATSAATASITPPANELILLTVSSRRADSTNPAEPTASGNGLTWVVVQSTVYDDSGTTRRRLTTFRAMGSAPTTGAITISFGATQTSMAWIVDSIGNVDTSGTNGSGAVVQSGANQSTAGATSLTVTLSAFSHADNGAYGGFGRSDVGVTHTVGTGFTEVAQVQDSESGQTVNSEFRDDNDTTVDMSFSATTECGGVGIELKQAQAAAAAADPVSWRSLLGVGL